MSEIEALCWVVFIYFAPALVAFWRRSTWRWMALYVTLFFGWTVVGWFAGWIFAFHAREARSY